MTSRAEARRGQRNESGAGSSGKLIWILGGVGVLGVGIVLWNIVTTITDEAARGPSDFVYSSPQELIDMAQGVSVGDPDAPITLLEFADYQCPGCQAFWANVKPGIEDLYVATGQVRFIFHDFPLSGLHIHAFLAARAARCAGDQDNFWPYHDRLFQDQTRWGTRADPMDDFLAYADDLGLNRGDFEQCLKSDMHADLVTANILLGENLGVSGTPTLFMHSGDGRAMPVANPMDARAVLGAIDEALARIAARTPNGSPATATPAAEGTP